MARIKKPIEVSQKDRSPAGTPEARESQMIAMAHNLAEKQLKEGTASSQIITHFLQLGSTKQKLEQDILRQQRDLMEAKTEAIKSAKRVEELYTNALNAMRAYSGQVMEVGDD